MLLTMKGPRALSDFRLTALTSRLHEVLPDLEGIQADFLHLIDQGRALNPFEIERLGQLLHYGESSPLEDLGHEIILVPRLGTQTPWSTKATEILKICGLGAVRRIERALCLKFLGVSDFPAEAFRRLEGVVFDRMTQVVLARSDLSRVFHHEEPRPLARVPLSTQGRSALEQANETLGLALTEAELDYLEDQYHSLGRDPSDVELMMFAQANSEHCRHKIFNADWVVDGKREALSLFSMIRETSRAAPQGILSAYSDNAAVIEGSEADCFLRDVQDQVWRYQREAAHLLMKVETHNHPTAISPFPGAATGSGGEIRDEAATGRGSQTKAGLTGFSVSHLRIPGFIQPWEDLNPGKPGRIASPLDIMLQGPLGGAAFNNEFGRPNLCGYFRTFEAKDPNGSGFRGYHKPIMLAGGMGHIRPSQLGKRPLPPGAIIVVLGGPSLLIGLGGGAASSLASGESDETLDFASVQRENPEMQRRCQEVINQCNALGDASPILSIHDVGAGGLSNAVPEIIHDAGRGGRFELRHIHCDEPGLSPMQIWSNESQERYVMALDPAGIGLFEQFCERERCPYSVIGTATEELELRLTDAHFGTDPVNIPMSLLFGKPPKMQRVGQRAQFLNSPLSLPAHPLEEAVMRVLRHPAVADKSFLIHIGDRSVGGLVARDQMVGRWQVPVADVGVTASGFKTFTGEAMALGERSPIALIDPERSGRLAVAEALTNLAAASIRSLSEVKLSANWMAAAGTPEEDARLFDTVRAVALELCPSLGIAIPVGKDSLSMKTVWHDGREEISVRAPLSLVITAFAPVTDIRNTLTPELRTDAGPTRLLLVDLGGGQNRLGGSILAQVFGQLGHEAPDLDQPIRLRQFFEAIQQLNEAKVLQAYHDRSDGGLLACLAEMAFAARCGLEINLDVSEEGLWPALFNEELGAVIQILERDRTEVTAVFEAFGLLPVVVDLGAPRVDSSVVIRRQGQLVFQSTRLALQREWAATSHRLVTLRDNPETASEAYQTLADEAAFGLSSRLNFDPHDDVSAPYLNLSRPRMAILREQGVNGHVEMAAAFDRVGFEAVDVHMSDLLMGRQRLQDFKGLAACGGFSYGDVLGAGGGWARSILFNEALRDQFEAFFQRPDSFGLGVCNGCQMMSHLRALIPGATGWPDFLRNRSEQFEARVVNVRVDASASIFLKDMAGSILPVVVAHGEGRVAFSTTEASAPVALRYVDALGSATERFPLNPNGSPEGATGFTTADGRFTIMMPHPERCIRAVQNSWRPREWGEDGPWLRLFANARVSVG